MKEEMKKLLIDKKENYAKYVREMHIPAKCKKKELERKELIEAIKHPVRESIKYKPSTVVEINLKRSKSLSESRTTD
jgi:hypothetical protein